MEERKLNEKESLELITRMIQNTQRNVGEGSGNSLIVAGVATFFTTCLVALLLYFTQSSYSYYVWNVIPLIVWFGFYKQSKRERVTTHFDKIITDIWAITTSFCVAIPIMLFIAHIGENDGIWHSTLILSLISIEMLLVSLSLGIMGRIINFPPLSIAAIVGMVLAVSPLYKSELSSPYSIMALFALWSIVVLVIPGVKLNCSIKKSSKC